MKKYKLAPYFSLGFFDRELHVGFGSIQKIIYDKDKQNAIIEMADFLKTPRTLSAVNKFIHRKSPKYNFNLHEIYQAFVSGNLLIEEGAYIKHDRYSRSLLFYNMYTKKPKKVQEHLRNKHVVILGCGGIGNIISVNLATSGIGKITLIDGDTIELSNLTRQIMFNENDVGKSKTLTLQQQLKKRASNVDIQTIETLIDSKEKTNIIPACDLVIVSGDQDNLIYHVNDYCFQKKIPFLNVGYIQDIAVWGPLIQPGITPCFGCFSNMNICTEEDCNNTYSQIIKKINEGQQAPSIGPINMLAASLACLDILKFLGKFSEAACSEQRIGLWSHNLEITYQKNNSSARCNICRMTDHE